MAVDTAAYRIIQESLTNVVRHAQASQVIITIQVEAHRLRLSIVDNGLGASTGAPAGSGIAGMAERARLLGGSLTARSPETTADPPGFEVVATLPLKDTP